MIKELKQVYMDENGNTWDKSVYSIEDATMSSNYLVRNNCHMCEDCELCEDCSYCVKCTLCNNCVNCTSCNNCIDLVGRTNCNDVKHDSDSRSYKFW